MKVAQLMSRDLITVAPDDSVEQAVKLLQQRGVRHLLVLKRDRLVGIVSDRDIKRAMDPRRTRKKLMGIGGLFFLLEPVLVEEIMTRDPVTIAPETTVDQAAYIMVERRFGALPIVRNGRTMGIVTETDLLRYYAEEGLEAKPRKGAAAASAVPRRRGRRRT
jgi:acetoin utilization protein AcuB